MVDPKERTKYEMEHNDAEIMKNRTQLPSPHSFPDCTNWNPESARFLQGDS